MNNAENIFDLELELEVEEVSDEVSANASHYPVTYRCYVSGGGGSGQPILIP